MKTPLAKLKKLTGKSAIQTQQCVYVEDDWFALGDSIDSYCKPFHYRISGSEAESLNQFYVDKLGNE